MFCCAPPSLRKFFYLQNDDYEYKRLRNEQTLCIVYDEELFKKKRNYLPKLREHKVQQEPGYVIDDPSSIFYDPDEKSGFVYGSYDSEYDGNIAYGNEACLGKTEATKTGHTSLDSSLDLDDSLDLISNIPTTPTANEISFDHAYDIPSRRESSEQELVDSCDEATYHSYNIDMNKTPVNLLLSSEQQNVTSQMSNLRVYEDSGYGSGGQKQRKDYNSDNESTNKYQDSGIYEDEVFSDSPKHTSDSKMNNESFIHDVEFEMDDFLPEHSERHTAFKTPSSSPLKLEPSVTLSKINGKQETSKGRLTRFLQQEREDVPIVSSGLDYYHCIDEKETAKVEAPLCLNDRPKTSKPLSRRSSAKYSHVQAKVQTRFKNSTSPGRSTSPPRNSTSPAGRKTPTRPKSKEPTYKPMSFGKPKIENIKSDFRKKAKPRVGSLDNVSHSPGGGQTKVFKQKLEFRKNAEPRTDTHGIEMYSHLPQEFQEIARRLSRQDHQLKLGKRHNTRGRTISRSSSTVGSSRASSASPTRGRSKTRNRPPTPSLPLQKTTYRSTSPPRHDCLSRSSSIRSIPSTPNLHNKHPATSSVLYDKKCRSRNGSPCCSRPHSPRSNCSSRASSPNGSRSRSRSKSRSRPGTPKSGDSQPTTPIRQLYQFTQANTFMPGSPKSSGSQPVFHFVPVR